AGPDSAGPVAGLFNEFFAQGNVFLQRIQHARFFSQPLLLGKNGIVERKPIGTLSAFEQKSLDGMLDTLKKDIALGEEFVK
ncbi:hypothetical protein ACC771_21650, partial [Rhizobium ruizarguesonis]